MKKINHIGYYLSAPSYFEDYHAGAKFEQVNYLAFYFGNDGIVYRKGKKNSPIYSKDDFLKIGAKGEYTIQGNIVEYVFKKGQRFEIRRKLTILGLDLLKDQDDDEYRWTGFPKESEDEDALSEEVES